MGRKKQPDSWRSKGKGKCFTTKVGQVVCEGSEGMNYQKKGRTKSTKVGTRVEIGSVRGRDRLKRIKEGKFEVIGTTAKGQVKLVRTNAIHGGDGRKPSPHSEKYGGQGETFTITKNYYNKYFTRE